MLQMNELPTVVRARKAYDSSNPENSIVANELLIVRKAARKRIGKNQLKVFSLTSKKEKTLSENCLGHFSTKPRDVCMYLPDLVKYAPDIFPCKSILFANKETSQSKVPSKFSSSIVTLMHHSIETSLVVTSALEGSSEDARLLDIPIDLDIQVRVAGTTEAEAQKLAQSTAYFYNHFNPSRLQSYIRNAKSRNMEETQALLYRTIRPESRRRGIKITRPSSIMETTKDGLFRSQTEPEIEEDIYDDVIPVEEPRYMSPRPAGNYATPTTSAEKPPLPERNKAQSRTPGYSYVDMDSLKRSGPERATRALTPSAGNIAPRGEHAPSDSSFGSTGSGGAVVERSMSCGEEGGGRRAIGGGGAERGSYSDGAIVMRRGGGEGGGRITERGGRGGEGSGRGSKRESESGTEDEHDLDAFLLDLKSMADSLDSVLQQTGGTECSEEEEEGGVEEREMKYSKLSYNIQKTTAEISGRYVEYVAV